MDIRVRLAEGCAALSPNLLWDSLWNPVEGRADWAQADGDESANRGGLRSKQALATAVILCLFTDKRCPEDHPLRYLADRDTRGWWGDAIDVRADLGETELGSLLWLFERSSLTAQTPMWIEAIAQDALAPLIAQGAAVEAIVAVEADPANNRADMTVKLIGKDGKAVFDQRFADLWSQIAANGIR